MPSLRNFCVNALRTVCVKSVLQGALLQSASQSIIYVRDTIVFA